MRSLFIFILLCALQPIAFAQAKPDSLELFLNKIMQKRRIPGLQVAVVRGGKIVFLKALGTANLQNSVPVTDKTIFSINSATKAFTGVAIMQLVDDGKIDIAAPLSRYLDGLPALWQPVTIRQLLTHTSGLPDVLAPTAQGTGSLVGANEDDAWAKVQTMPMDFAAGTRYRYNQTNYLLLGKIIDKLSGKPFTHFIKQRQFDAAGMTLTGFGDSRDVIPDRAPVYRFNTSIAMPATGSKELQNGFDEFPLFLRTAGGINTTAENVANWMIALQNGKLLSRASLEKLWTRGTFNDGSPTPWALGWPTVNRTEHPVVAGIGGRRSAFYVYPKDDLAIVVLTNLAGADPETFIDEIAGHYIPELLAENGGGLPTAVKLLRTELLKRGFSNAVDIAAELKKTDTKFNLAENDLNAWGYYLAGNDQKKEALEIFKLNASLYPQSGNVYDSLAEAYEAAGDKELAIRNYKRSLELDPKNSNAVEQLKRLDPK